jgi:DNA repair protein SbcC/Rad50
LRPIKLELTGFTCFKELQSISFDDLELFAIVGQTGAGKSSILDAITYALFGETSRLGSRGLEQLVSQGANGMQVALEFESGHERFRVSRAWSIKAAERQVRFEKFDGVRFVTAVEGVKVKDVAGAIQAVVGLDFDGFTRAILLPQGEFDRFLRGDAKERRELLKGLLNLEHFEAMRERANAIARDAKARSDQIKLLLEGEYAGATLEASEALEAELEVLKSRIITLSSQLERDRILLSEARELQKLNSEFERVKVKLKSLETQNTEVASARDRAALGRKVAAVMPLVTVLERTELGLQKSNQELTQAKLEIEKVNALEASSDSKLDAAREAAEILPELEHQANELASSMPKLERLRALGGNLDLEHESSAVFSERRMAELEELKAKLSDFKRAVSDARDAKRDLVEAKSNLEKLSVQLETLKTDLNTCKISGTETGARVKELESELTQARRDEGAAALTVGLKLGDPCPVCGTPLKVLPGQTESRIPDLENYLELERAKLVDLRSEYQRLLESQKNTTINLDKTQVEAEKFERQLEQTSEQVHLMKLEFERSLGQGEDPKILLDDTRNRVLAGLALEIREATGGRDPVAVIAELSKRRKTLQTNLDAAREALSKVQAASAQARTTLEIAEKNMQERKIDFEERQTELNSALLAAEISSVEEARDAALPDKEVLKLEALEREHLEALNATRADENRILGQLAGRTFDAEFLVQVEQAVKNAENDQKTANSEQGRLEQLQKDISERRVKAKDLNRERNKLEKQYDIYAALAADLKGNEFQEFMLEGVQQELLLRASHIMREVTRERYTLELKEGEYVVLDNWNGLDARSVKTLSGGESFIASLSLALALSDYLAGHKALGALFLDEGFGTLDADALDAVSSVLEAIQTQGRMVGVITHVASLAERLPNRLVIEKGQSTSRARWES